MRSGFAAVFAVSLLLILLLTPGCNCRLLPRTDLLSDTAPVIPHDTIAASTSVDLDSFTITERVGSEIKFRLHAEHAQQLQSGDYPLQRMTVIFYNAGRESLELRADSGTLHGTARDITLQGNVVATGIINPVRFFTDDLFWDNAHEVLRTPDRVRVEREGMVMTGTGLIADKTLQRLELQKDIQSELQ